MDALFEKIGKKAIAIPLLVAFVLACILAVAVAPLLRADPNEVPFAIVNLDEGATTIAGSSNVGKTLTENLVSGESSLTSSGDGDEDDGDNAGSTSAAQIVWTQLGSEDELVEALDSNLYYGGIVIPENFTSQQLRTTVGLGNAPELKIYLNAGKNPQMASTMRTTIMETMLQQGIAADVETVNDADVGGGTLASTIGVQMIVMPLFIMTMIGSILTSIIFWRKDALGLRKRSQVLGLVGQVLVIAVFSAVFALLATGIDAIAGGMDLPFTQLYTFLWLADLLVMLLFVGLCDLFFPLGALVAVTVFALGLGTAMLAPEMLPQFWRDWVYPWAPQACFGQGIRQALYFGRMPGENIWTPLIVEGVIGGVALLLAAVIGKFRARNREEAGN